MRSIVNTNRHRGKIIYHMNKGISRRRIMKFHGIIRKDPSFSACRTPGTRKRENSGNRDMIFVTVHKSKGFVRTHRKEFATASAIKHKVIDPGSFVNVTIGAHIGMRIYTISGRA
jgi:hypothetical protein